MTRLDYWKYFPERWLLSDKVRKMHPIAHSGYRFLCDHAMMQELPGILPDDDDKLHEWSRLNAKQWVRYRCTILAAFAPALLISVKPHAKVWQHCFICDLFRDFHRQNWEKSTKGLLAAHTRWSKKGDSSVKMPQYADPYNCIQRKEVSITSSPPLALAGAADGEVEEKVTAGQVGAFLKTCLSKCEL